MDRTAVVTFRRRSSRRSTSSRRAGARRSETRPFGPSSTGSAVGPRPCPAIVRELQSVIGREGREQMLAVEGRLPEAVVACVGGGSNAIGAFAGFVEDAEVRLVGVEAAGAASLGTGRAGVL